MLKFMQRLGIAALALALPALAQAAILTPDVNTNINPGIVYKHEADGVLGANTYTYKFPITVFGTPGLAITGNIGQTVNEALPSPVLFSDGVFKIVGTSPAVIGHQFVPTTISIGPGLFHAIIPAVPFVFGEEYELTFGFTTDKAADLQLSVSLQVVPLPAAGLLLLGGLGGLGLVARRRRAAAA